MENQSSSHNLVIAVAALVVTVIIATATGAWAILSAISDLRVEVAEMRGSLNEMRGALDAHLSHHHGISDASGIAGGEQKPPSN